MHSKKEVAEVRKKIRSLKSEKDKMARQCIEAASGEMLDLANRDVKPLHRLKTKLFIAQLELKEMGQVLKCSKMATR
ncbi:hypothetical protein GN244_ATG16405 [Phytophthora infestans]|uniref:Uncharacterized protein n=1 Tax=Phytophthora infestans TaxID=4787 RepID=A0A833ST85_PHYIN|nr:hypothetical protein GN244_ATG16405 [Phytophthora infestans]